MPSDSRKVYRVAQTKYGPISPPPRIAADDPVDWSRWDTPGRTIYGGDTAVASLVEVLGYVTPDPPSISMTDLFDDVGAGDMATLGEQLEREMPRYGAMPWRSISKGWRDLRALYEIQLPSTGWFIDITTGSSINAIARAFPDVLAQHRVAELTLTELTDSAPTARRLTTAIATRIRTTITLGDGSVPHGVVYPSKRGSDFTNWALWMRRTDDNTGVDVDAVAAEQSIRSLGRHTIELIEAADMLGIPPSRIY